MNALAEIPLVIWLAGGIALYMAWSIGANDVANAMGTSVGSGALTVWAAVLVASLFEFSGAFLAGGHVTDTVRKGILDMSLLSDEQVIWGMLASLMSAGTLLLAATRYGLPISTTHSIVGAIVGFGAVSIGPDAVRWGKIAEIVFSWISSPLLSGSLAFVIFQITRSLILSHENPLARVRKIGPYFFFYVFFIIGLVTLFKGLKNVDIEMTSQESVLWSLAFGLFGAAVGFVLLRRARAGEKEPGHRFSQTERVFVVLQILTACAVAFAHGSNDVANAVGPLAAIVERVNGVTELTETSAVAPWMLAVGGLGIGVGLATWGYRVMETVGKKITELTPSRGFAAELAAATTIVLASRMGIPVSTTHTLVGAVLGVGLARGIGAVDLRVVANIVTSWVATLPASAVLSIFFFYFFKGLLGP